METEPVSRSNSSPSLEPIPNSEIVMPLVLEALGQGETSLADLARSVARTFALDEEQCARLIPSGGELVVENRIRWARFSLLKAGLLTRPERGRYLISPAGREFLLSGRKLDDAALRDISMEYRTWLDRRDRFIGPKIGRRSNDVDPGIDRLSHRSDAVLTPDERIDEASLELQATVRADLLDRIKQQSSTFFERLVVALMLAMGYGTSEASVRQAVGHSGDGGIDGIIDIDRLGRDRLYLQAKRYSTASVGRPELQQFVGAISATAARDGIFVTTSTFSPSALAYVRSVPYRIALVDGIMLADLMIEYNVGIRAHRRIEIKRLDEDFFAGDD